jgi:hypothetical protein
MWLIRLQDLTARTKRQIDWICDQERKEQRQQCSERMLVVVNPFQLSAFKRRPRNLIYYQTATRKIEVILSPVVALTGRL